ncbi:unnamed protein product [Ixodes hexagonus]
MWTFLAVLSRRQGSFSHPVKQLFYASVGVFVGVLTCMAGMRRPRGNKVSEASLLLRSLMTAGAFACRFASLWYLPLVDSAVLTSTSLVLTRMPELARGHVSKHHILIVALLLTVSALGLLVFSDLSGERPQGLLCALASTGLHSSQQLLSHGTAAMPLSVLLLHTSFILLLCSTVLSAFVMDSPEKLFTEADMGAMSLTSHVGFAYVYFVSKGREADSGGLANMYKNSFDVIIAIVFTKAFLDEHVGAVSYVAALLVVTAVVVSELNRLAGLSRYRKRFRFFM